MGGALLKAFIDGGVLDTAGSAVIDPRASAELEALCQSSGLALNPESLGVYDVCLLGVKPQQFPGVLPTLSWPSMEEALFVSIAAGLTGGEIAMLLKEQVASARVLRVMPSLPAKVGRGVTLFAENPNLTAADRSAAEALFGTAGLIEWCDSEDRLDRLMGVTGCAPAFLMMVVEGLIDAAIAQGATPQAARRMAEETFIATAQLLAEDGRAPGELREAVTSPGGTTAAGLAVLEDQQLRASFVSAVEGAYARAQELAGKA